ncbi:uncharacterized protein BDZ99DRAFT_214662 [Mytilinidion resinicola]|uniref:Uncharacterized protein n=1 Tax=Mytilinidion resinicola TaxID=574789 RepID=A0A6A6Y240_9PEZI|nr:uncharacterized protein BDZ99DRAFT_214662 [Mytilinidion resinicola]KAF2801877.1 hypothetical protein BDZ99DRAFT_214662 [Mytilinidion resinicola]
MGTLMKTLADVQNTQMVPSAKGTSSRFFALRKSTSCQPSYPSTTCFFCRRLLTDMSNVPLVWHLRPNFLTWKIGYGRTLKEITWLPESGDSHEKTSPMPSMLPQICLRTVRWIFDHHGRSIYSKQTDVAIIDRCSSSPDSLSLALHAFMLRSPKLKSFSAHGASLYISRLFLAAEYAPYHALLLSAQFCALHYQPHPPRGEHYFKRGPPPLETLTTGPRNHSPSPRPRNHPSPALLRLFTSLATFVLHCPTLTGVSLRSYRIHEHGDIGILYPARVALKYLDYPAPEWRDEQVKRHWGIMGDERVLLFEVGPMPKNWEPDQQGEMWGAWRKVLKADSRIDGIKVFIRGENIPDVGGDQYWLRGWNMAEWDWTPREGNEEELYRDSLKA